jgi:hypothetical protein
MKNKKNKHQDLLSPIEQPKEEQMAKMSELDTPIPFPEGFSWYDEYTKCFNNIEGVIIFNTMPEFVGTNYPGVKHSFFGAIKFKTVKMQGNGIVVPRQYHKLFIAQLIDPPEAKNLQKSVLATERDHFNQWKINSHSDEHYRELKANCESFGILLLQEMDILLLASLVDELRKDI